MSRSVMADMASCHQLRHNGGRLRLMMTGTERSASGGRSRINSDLMRRFTLFEADWLIAFCTVEQSVRICVNHFHKLC